MNTITFYFDQNINVNIPNIDGYIVTVKDNYISFYNKDGLNLDKVITMMNHIYKIYGYKIKHYTFITDDCDLLIKFNHELDEYIYEFIPMEDVVNG